MMRLAPCRRHLGFTIVEVMVTLALLGILVAIAAPALADFIHLKRMEGVANELQSDVALMRAESMGKTTLGARAFLQVGSGGAKNCYAIYIDDDLGGTVCDCLKPPGQACVAEHRPDSEIKVVKFPEELGIRLSTTAASNQAHLGLYNNAMRFGPANFRILIEGKREGALRLDFSSTGRIKVCSPQGKLRGYPACV